MENKIIIAGGRTFTDYDLLCRTMVEFITEIPYTEIEVVCGLAKGADRLGNHWAWERGIPVAQFPADWDKFGRSAGPRRNKRMAEYATHLVAFWDGKSRGTKSMIDLGMKFNLVVKVVGY